MNAHNNQKPITTYRLVPVNTLVFFWNIITPKPDNTAKKMKGIRLKGSNKALNTSLIDKAPPVTVDNKSAGAMNVKRIMKPIIAPTAAIPPINNCCID